MIVAAGAAGTVVRCLNGLVRARGRWNAGREASRTSRAALRHRSPTPSAPCF